MALDNQITIEDLSAEPIQPAPVPNQSFEDITVAQESQGFVEPARPVVAEEEKTDAEKAGVVVEVVLDGMVPDETPQTGSLMGVSGPQVGPAVAVDQQAITAGITPTKQPTTVDGSPIMPPAKFEQRASDPNLTDDEFEVIKRESAQFYIDNVLGGNGDKAARLEVIKNSTYYKIPRLDKDGNAVVDENGDYVYVSDAIPFVADDTDTRVIQMFEMAYSNNGVYHFFSGDSEDPEDAANSEINIGLQQMEYGDQNPLTAFFYRVESEEGGMRNYTNILRDVGINDPARLVYLARHQAQAGPLTGLEAVRMGGNIRDMFKFFADIGMGDGFQIPFTDTRLGFGMPLQEFTASIPFYLYEAMSLQRWDPFSEATPYQDIIDSDVPRMIAKIMQGGIAPMQFDDAVTALKNEYPHATEAQIEAVLMYSPDLMTTGKRFAVESVVTSGTLFGAARMMARSERAKFVDYVREITGADLASTKSLPDALAELEKKGLSSDRMLQDYYEKQGLSGAAAELMAKALDIEVQRAARKPGPYYENVVKKKLDDAQSELDKVTKKLDAAVEQGNEGLIKSLEARRMLLKNDIVEYKADTWIDPAIKDYLKDEGIATTAAATIYQLTYDIGGNNPTTASIASFLAAMTTAHPSVRDVATNGVENTKIALSSDLKSDQVKAAVAIRRHLEKAPKEMRDHILQFMEKKAIAREELSMLTYPKGHPQAGQPIISPDLLDESFAQMSGLVSLRRMEKEVEKMTINFQKDAGKLSKRLWDLEQNYLQQAKLVDGLAQSVDALRYYRFSDSYSPTSEAGQMTDMLIKFYQESSEYLTENRARLESALDARDRDINKFFGGKLTTGQIENFVNNREELTDLLALDKARYVELGLPEDAGPAEVMRKLQDYYVNLNQRVTDSFKAHNRFVFNSDEAATTANNDFRSFVTVQESEAYGVASQKFDELRANPLYADARMDLSDVLLQFFNQGAEGGLSINTQAIANIVPIYGQGTMSSRYLTNKNFSKATSSAIAGLFNDAATEYLDDLTKRMGAEAVEDFYARADLPEDASNVDRWFAVKEFFDNNKEKLGDNYEDLYPRLGVDTSTFMHIVSGLGRSGAKPDSIAHRQLRKELLERANYEFFDEFYGAKSDRQNIPGFAEDYAKVREFYQNRYLTPFRGESSVVKRLLNNEDKALRNVFDQFLTEMGASDAGADLPKLRENFYRVMEDMIGEKIDVSNAKGQAIRSMLTKMVQAEIAGTPGSKRLQAYLLQDYAREEFIGPKGFEIQVKLPVINPGKIREIEKELASIGPVNTPLYDNLLKRDVETGQFLFADVNGQPLIDPASINPISFDDLLGYGVKEAEEAVIKVNEELADARTAMVREANKKDSRIRKELDTREKLTTSLRANSKGLGSALYDLTGSDGGLNDLAQLRQDFVYSRATVGESAEEAGAIFDDVVRDSVLDHVMTQVMEPGAEMLMKTIDPKTGEPRMVAQKGVELNLNRLGEVLGLRGDTVSESPRGKALQALLGKEAVDHLKFVFKELYQYDPKTGALNLTGISTPLSAESMLSRGTSFFRGVISLRWLVSEAAIRSSREANYQLTKLMLGDPKVGREVLDMVLKKNFDLDKREPDFYPVLISQIAKFDALQQIALQDKDYGELDFEFQMEDLLLSP